MFENRHVPRIGKYDNVLCVFEKNQEDEMGGAGEHPYYMVRRQKRLLPTHKKWIKIRYPNIIEKGICDDANAIHAWSRFRASMGKGNHFSLPDEQREFFENLFNIDL